MSVKKACEELYYYIEGIRQLSRSVDTPSPIISFLLIVPTSPDPYMAIMTDPSLNALVIGYTSTHVSSRYEYVLQHLPFLNIDEAKDVSRYPDYIIELAKTGAI